MATSSEVKQGLDDIAEIIRTARSVFTKCKSQIQEQNTILTAINSNFSDIAVTIDGYTPTGSFEELAQDEKAKLLAERNSLQTEMQALIANF